MPYKGLSATKIARAVGCHPNTVRLYEAWGLLPPVQRNEVGYRLYTPVHLAQMRLARRALNSQWPGRAIRRSAMALVKTSAVGDLEYARQLASQHREIVQDELAMAEEAAHTLEDWAQRRSIAADQPPVMIGAAARLLGVSIDMLRNWEANGLVSVPRDPGNRYRWYGPAEIDRLRIIRMLRSAGYSPMAILRMLIRFDQGQTHGLRDVLDTPAPDEDIFMAADRWLTTLTDQADRAEELIMLLEERIAAENAA
jgi:DNA-binding transcriptional MerR regulator